MERRRRWILRSFLVVLALVAGAAAASPWWTPWAVSFSGRWFDFTVGDWEKDGWEYVTYHDVVWERDNVRVSVDSIRVPVFVVWPEQLSGEDVRTLKATGVSVRVTPLDPAESESRGPSQASTHSVIAGIARMWPTLQEWLLPTRVENLVVDAGPTLITLKSVDWNGETLRVSGPIPDRDIEANASLVVQDGSLLKLRLEIPEESASIDVDAKVGDGGTEAVASGHWLENSANLRAHFDETAWIPATMNFMANELTIEPGDFGIDEFETLTGNVQVDWTGVDYVAAIKAEAKPAEQWNELPPVDVDLRVSGDMEFVRLDAATITVPGFHGELSQPLTFSIDDRAPRGSAEFRVRADLSEFPWTEATGTISGRAQISGDASTEPEVEFDLSGEGVRWRDAEMRSLHVAGLGRPSMVRVDDLTVELAGNSSVQGTAVIDLARRQMEKVVFKVHATAEALRPWFPTLPEFGEVDMSFKAAGALEGPAHSGSLKWTAVEGFPGGAVSGEASWEGSGLERISLQANVSSQSGVTMPMEAAIRRENSGEVFMELRELAWNDSEGEWWKIAQPARIDWQPTDGRPRISVTGLQIRGEQIELDADGWTQWPIRGEVSLHSNGFDPGRLAPLIPAADSGADIEDLQVEAEWDDGPVVLNGSTLLSYSPVKDVEYVVSAEFASDAHNLSFRNVSVRDASGDVLRGHGRLPLSLVGRESGFSFQMPQDSAINLDLESTSNPAFWSSIGALTGWTIVDPKVKASASGSLKKPRGHFEFSTNQLKPPNLDSEKETPFPALNDVRLILEADDLGLRVTDLRFSVEENWITAKGLLPWNVIESMRANEGFHWRETEFTVASAPLPLAIAARMIPTLLSPEGQTSLRIEHRPGAGFSGFFWLHNASLLQIPPIGSIREIGGQAVLEGYRVSVPNLVGHLGGRPIEISGSADVSSPGTIAYDFAIDSSRVPLARQRGLVLRASMDLHVGKAVGAPAHISGNVDMGSSFFVSELTSMLTSGSVASPEERPPYFSITTDPLSKWTLDVALHGDNFMRVDTPFYKGTLSADLNLEGTLGEPRAVGRVTSSKGRVIFPFGVVSLDSLDIGLTRENPYDATIFARGSTRVYGHDVRLEVSGTSSDPRLMFTSDPPLPSHEIFLMLSTGQIPDAQHAFTTSERAQRLAMFLGQNLVRRFGIGGTTEEGEDRLLIRPGEEFSQDGGETIYVEYQLDGRWSVVGEKDRYSAYNGGIKFRLIEK